LAEYRHSVLAPLAKGPGRRPEIDFVICEKYPKVNVAVESKWIGRSEPSVQSVLWDLIRLELLAHHENARYFFVLGGKRSSLERFFARETFSDASSKPYRGPLLRHDNNVLHTIDLVPVVRVRIPLLKVLFGPYQDWNFRTKSSHVEVRRFRRTQNQTFFRSTPGKFHPEGASMSLSPAIHARNGLAPPPGLSRLKREMWMKKARKGTLRLAA
jgi:hypothetical protein